MKNRKTFNVFGRFEASTSIVKYPHIHIAVYTPGDDKVPLRQNPNRVGVLQLCFHDVSRVSDREWLANQLKGTGVEVSIFGTNHADQIARFVRDHPSIDHIVVNCDAGVSRSPAIAAALSRFYNAEDESFFIRYTPNRHVYRTLLSVLEENQ